MSSQVLAILLVQMLSAFFQCTSAVVDLDAAKHPAVSWIAPNVTYMQTYYGRLLPHHVLNHTSFLKIFELDLLSKSWLDLVRFVPVIAFSIDLGPNLPPK